MPRVHLYRAHGYVIASDLPLALPAAGEGSHADLTVRHGGRGDFEPKPASVDLLALLEDDDGTVYYSVARMPTGFTLRYGDVCEIRADPTFSDLVGRVSMHADLGVLSVLATGSILAVRLLLDGHLTLHASAVEINGHALAFVGAPGMGKSTLATLLCAGGHSLLTDDVLRVDVDDRGALLVWPGALETRLRESARDLVSILPGDTERRITADDRLAIAAPLVTDRAVPLAAVVVPRPSREITALTCRRLTAPAALASLVRFPRVIGWRDKASLVHQFERLGDLVERVPVYDAFIPWGPPFPPTLTQELSALVEG